MCTLFCGEVQIWLEVACTYFSRGKFCTGRTDWASLAHPPVSCMTPQSSRAMPRVHRRCARTNTTKSSAFSALFSSSGGCGFCGGTRCPGNPVARVRQRVRADGRPTSSRQTEPRGSVGTRARAVISLSCPISVHGTSGLSHRKVPNVSKSLQTGGSGTQPCSCSFPCPGSVEARAHPWVPCTSSFSSVSSWSAT